jgi:hypothetical protein
MVDRWPDLVRGFDRLTVTSDLRERVEQRRFQGRTTASRPPSRRPQRIGLAVAGVCAAAAVGTVLVIAAHSYQDASRPASSVEIINPSETHVTTKIVGGSPGLRQAIHESLAGIGGTAIKTVTVVPAAKPRRVVLRFSLSATSGAQRAYANWQAGLVAAATRDRAIARGLEHITYYEGEDITTRLTAAEIPQRAANSPSARQLISRAQHEARKLGVTIDHITILKPYGLAAAVTLGIRNPGRHIAMQRASIEVLAFPEGLAAIGKPTAIDGSYVQLQAGHHPIIASSSDNRTNTAGMWIAPRYQS